MQPTLLQPRRRLSTALPWLRLLLALGLLLLSLPSVLMAPTYLLFYVAVGATEYGHWLALPAAALAVAGLWPHRRGRSPAGATRWAGRAATLLALGAVALFSTAALRGTLVAAGLDARLTAAFGPTAGAVAPLASPLNPLRLYTGDPTPVVTPATYTYAQRDGQPLQLDAYRPQPTGAAAAQAASAVLVIHGGSWRAGDRAEQPALNSYLARRGYAVFSLTYRLAPKEHPAVTDPYFPKSLADVNDAITWVQTHAAEFGIDPSRIVLLGRSAGAQLALTAGYTRHDPAIRGVVDFYGPVDLDWGWENPGTVLDSRNILSGYLGGAPAVTRAVWDAAEAYRQVGPQSPPTLIIHGVRDEMVGFRHSLVLEQALLQAKRPYLLVQLPWATHGCDFNFSGPCGQISTYAVERFLAAVTR